MTYVREHLREYLPQIRGYARALTRNIELADDLVQDVCYRALKGEHTFKDGNMLAWLLCITHNCYVNQCRKWNREPHWVDLSLCNHTVEGNHDVQLHVRDVERMLASLPKNMQDVIRLCVIHDMTYEQASAILGIPDGTCRSRLSRARDELRYKRDSAFQGEAR